MEAVMSSRQPSILVVDDQPDNLRTLAAILSSEGYKVRKAVSGEIALDTACSQPPDLILLDIRMPQMDGYTVCLSLKASEFIKNIQVSPGLYFVLHGRKNRYLHST